MSEEKKIIEYLKNKGYENSVIGSINMPTYSEVGNPYAMRSVSVTVASVMADYIDNRTKPNGLQEAVEEINKFRREMGKRVEEEEIGDMPFHEINVRLTKILNLIKVANDK